MLSPSSYGVYSLCTFRFVGFLLKFTITSNELPLFETLSSSSSGSYPSLNSFTKYVSPISKLPCQGVSAIIVPLMISEAFAGFELIRTVLTLDVLLASKLTTFASNFFYKVTFVSHGSNFSEKMKMLYSPTDRLVRTNVPSLKLPTSLPFR